MFQGFGGAGATSGRAGLTVHGTRAAVASVTGAPTARQHLAASAFDVATDGEGNAVFDDLRLEGTNLGSLRISTVLPGGSYQLMLEEVPNAPREELRNAIGWRIRDRIEVPLDEAIIELLDMPAQARAGSKPNAYAAVTRRAVVEELVARVRGAGLKLDAIDLPELCLRNIAVRLPQDENGVAFLHFTEECGLLTITRRGVLYLIRRIDVGQLALEQTPGTEVRAGLIPTICLELQRSLDYYETQYDMRPINELVMAPGSGSEPLNEAVREQLGLNVSNLDLTEVFDVASDLGEQIQHECLLAVGAALRTESPASRSA